jgi:hypothetical protein
VTGLVRERKRVEGKLNRLIERNDQILTEIMKSKTTKLQKTDNYQLFVKCITELCCHLEEKYPYLKREVTHNKKGEPRWTKPIEPQKAC